MSFKNTEKLLIELNLNVISVPYESGDIAKNYLKKYFNNKDKECNMEIEFFSGLNIADSFANEYELNNKKNIYSSVCDFETYKINYYRRLQESLDEIPDAGEEYFICNELKDLSRDFCFPFVDEKTKTKIFYSGMRKEDFLLEKMEAIGYEYLLGTTDENGLLIPTAYQEYTYRKIKNFKSSNLALVLNIKMKPTEFMELFKAIWENGRFPYKQQADALIHFSKLFNMDIKNPDIVLQNVKNRNIGSETLFLDKLKSKFLKFRNKKLA